MRVSLLKLDFRSFEENLFCGNKNGYKFREKMKIKEFDYMVFICKEKQVVTSSFLVGLLKDEILDLYDKIYIRTGRERDTINEIWGRIDLTNISKTNKMEFERFLNRTFFEMLKL